MNSLSQNVSFSSESKDGFSDHVSSEIQRNNIHSSNYFTRSELNQHYTENKINFNLPIFGSVKEFSQKHNVSIANILIATISRATGYLNGNKSPIFVLTKELLREDVIQEVKNLLLDTDHNGFLSYLKSLELKDSDITEKQPLDILSVRLLIGENIEVEPHKEGIDIYLKIETNTVNCTLVYTDLMISGSAIQRYIEILDCSLRLFTTK